MCWLRIGVPILRSSGDDVGVWIAHLTGLNVGQRPARLKTHRRDISARFVTTSSVYTCTLSTPMAVDRGEGLGNHSISETLCSSSRTQPHAGGICGGHALDLHLGRSWRRHDDIDVGVLRGDAPALATLLEGWNIEIAAADVLIAPLEQIGTALLRKVFQNNLWCRKRSDQPWCLDVTIGDGIRGLGSSVSDPAIRVLWAQAILRTELLGCPTWLQSFSSFTRAGTCETERRTRCERTVIPEPHGRSAGPDPCTLSR